VPYTRKDDHLTLWKTNNTKQDWTIKIDNIKEGQQVNIQIKTILTISVANTSLSAQRTIRHHHSAASRTKTSKHSNQDDSDDFNSQISLMALYPREATRTKNRIQSREIKIERNTKTPRQEIQAIRT